MDKRTAYFLWGLFFLIVMEIQFQAQITGNIPGLFLVALFVDIPFLLFAYYASPKLDAVLENNRFREIVFYIVYGLLGLLVIEWAYMGNTPWGNPDAIQFVMFTNWGGVVLFARILTSENAALRKLKTWMLHYFVGYSVVALVGGFFIPHELRLALVVLVAAVGYGLMNLFFLWYFIIRYNQQSPAANS